MKPSIPALRRLGPLLAGLTLVACASTPSPVSSIEASAASIDAARGAGASELAAVEMNNARTKLERARALAQSGDQRGAVRLAEQADVDAQLARARAGAEKSRRAAAEVDAGLQTLRDELNRAAPTALPRAP